MIIISICNLEPRNDLHQANVTQAILTCAQGSALEARRAQTWR